MKRAGGTAAGGLVRITASPGSTCATRCNKLRATVYHRTLPPGGRSDKTPPEGVEAREAIRLSPRFAAAYYHLGRALIVQGRINEAMDAFEYEVDIGAGSMGELGIGQAWLARGEYARALDVFQEHGDETPLTLVYKAAALCGLGREDEGLKLLEKAVEGGYGDFPYLRTNRYFDPLRDDPRFETLLHKAH